MSNFQQNSSTLEKKSVLAKHKECSWLHNFLDILSAGIQFNSGQGIVKDHNDFCRKNCSSTYRQKDSENNSKNMSSA